MSTPFVLEKDINGNVTYRTPISDIMMRVELDPNIPQSVTVPPNCTSALFSYSSGGDVWVDYENTATLPSGTFEETTSELTPLGKYGLEPGQTISCICATNAYVHVSFWK